MLKKYEIDGAQYRDAMAHFAGHVHVVTTDGAAGRRGVTVIAACSVSDRPPTVLVCLNRENDANDLFVENGVFALNADVAGGDVTITPTFELATPVITIIPSIALGLGVPWLVASAMGVITGVVGGILRDVLCNEEPLIFNGPLYATPAWFGALLLVGLTEIGVTAAPAALAAGAFVLLGRLLALRYDLTLPTYSARL